MDEPGHPDSKAVNGGTPEIPREPPSPHIVKMGKKEVAVVMSALCLVLFLAALDMTVVSTALPTIVSSFHASESGYSWIASAYLLGNAATIPLWGKSSDIWGRRPIILLANFFFLLGSLVCALAQNTAMIVTGRAIQGIGGGGIFVLANIAITDLFSIRERPIYYGLFGATWALAGSLGPIIGGAFTTYVTWRWCFYLNLPIAGLSFLVLFFFLRIESRKTSFLAGLHNIDWAGTSLIIGGTLMFLFGLELGGVNYSWASATVICLILFGVLAWVLAMWSEFKLAKHPIVPTRVFIEWSNLVILVICFCQSFVFISGAYYLPLYFQTVLLASPIQSGVYLLPMVLSLSVASGGTGILINRTGHYRELIQAGLGFMTLGFGLFIDLKPYASWTRIIIFQLIAGFGVGPNFQAPLVALQANVRRADVATATATFSFMRQIASSVSIVLGTVIYQNVMRQQAGKLVAAIGRKNATVVFSSFAGSSKPLVRSLTTAQRDIVLSAFTHALSRLWIFYAAMGGVGLIVSVFIRSRELSTLWTIQQTALTELERANPDLVNEATKRKANADV